jgi:hypothetical protein
MDMYTRKSQAGCQAAIASDTHTTKNPLNR